MAVRTPFCQNETPHHTWHGDIRVICAVTAKTAAPPVFWELDPYLKSFALIVILLRTGLGIKRQTLKQIGGTAFRMSFIPCITEGAALTILFHNFFGFGWTVSALTAFMIAAVSPAVVVPSMLDLKEKGRGKNEVPTLVRREPLLTTCSP